MSAACGRRKQSWLESRKFQLPHRRPPLDAHRCYEKLSVIDLSVIPSALTQSFLTEIIPLCDNLNMR
ncbi:hypothetical protein E2C01_101347 [Portunus trituberculatus]|uniref:Uncharacterized protein n=1 Tax=Portunus trituberculatus TaxID=210409 RepID=A0A5B7KFD0_PORTR|nr:hypothetical protein [Portunus trituberculatus]